MIPTLRIPALRKATGSISNEPQRKAMQTAKQRAKHRVLKIRVVKLEDRIEKRKLKIEELGRRRCIYLSLIHRDIKKHHLSIRELNDKEHSYQELKDRVENHSQQGREERQSTDDLTKSAIVNNELEEQAINIQVLKSRVLRARQLTRYHITAGWKTTAQYNKQQELLDIDIREREVLSQELKTRERLGERLLKREKQRFTLLAGKQLKDQELNQDPKTARSVTRALK